MENNLSLAEQWNNLQPELIQSFADSLYMISVSIVITVIVGLFLGIVLFLTSNRLLFKNVFIYKTVDFIVNTIRSIPFIILLVFLIPFTLFLLGKSTGPTGAIVPLTVAAIPLFTRLVDTSLNEIDYGIIESAVASGASLPLIIKEVLIPEAMFGIVQSITLTLINLIAFSAMAGVVGGGGIGDLAIRYGYYRFDNFTMWITVILLIILVQITQYIGNYISKKFKKINIRRFIIMTKLKKILTIAFTAILAISLTACGASKSNSSSSGDKKEIKIGATSGPYADMVNKAIKPLLEKKGYTVKVTEFSDYIQPNKALNSGELDANLFQHKIYMKKFAEQNNMDLTALAPVPTAPMGLYSDKVKDLKDIPDGAEVTLPNDPSNAARAYALLAAADLIKIKPNTDVLKITKNDVIENPKNLKFTELEAGQLARSLGSTTLSAVPGNFALAAKFDLTKALKLEKMNENNRNNIVVTTAKKDSQLAKDLIEVVQSKEFDEIIDKEFKGFDKPEK